MSYKHIEEANCPFVHSIRGVSIASEIIPGMSLIFCNPISASSHTDGLYKGPNDLWKFSNHPV